VRVLAIVYCFPPLLVPSALCYLKLILGMRENGADVEVLTIDPRSFLAPDPGLFDPSIQRVVPADLVQHQVWSLEASIVARGLKRLAGRTLLGMRLFEPKKREWIIPAMLRLRRLDLRRYDIVLTCSQPHVNHLLGLHLKKRTGLPWVAYFSDPWARRIYDPFPSERIAKYHRSLEAKVMRTADRVLFTSEEMLRLAEEDHSAALRGKAGVLPHAFVPEWYGPPAVSPRRPGPIRLLHTGHFYGRRSPAPLLLALGRLHRRRSLLDRLQVDSYGSFPPKERELARREGLEGVVRVHPTIPYLESLALMRDQDALLLIDAKLTETAESIFLPSKLVDYWGSGTPVLAITPIPGCVARVVTETGGVVCNIEKEEEIDAVILRLLDEGVLPPPRSAAIQTYQYKEVSRRLLACMDELGV